MPWTYDDHLPRALDRVRALLGDTDRTRPLVEDETILAVLAVQPDLVRAAVAVCGVLAATGGGQVVRKQVGPVTIEYQPRDFAALAAALTAQAEYATAASVLVAPYAGGLSVAEKEIARGDPDLVQPVFVRAALRSGDPLRPRW